MSNSFLAAAQRRQEDAIQLTDGSQILGSDPITPDGFLPIPVIDGETLTYERFLREFALPRQPCIITNIGRKWRANAWNVDYMLAHHGVDKDHKVYMADGPPQTSKEKKTTVGKALQAVRKAGAESSDHPFYLSAWDYVRGNSGALQEDFEVPRFFERAPAWLRSNVVLGNAQTDMKWLYIGSLGSGSSTHVDTNLTSAWLWVADGRKEWICAHGDDHALLTQGTGSRAYGYKGDDEDDDGSVPLPDFFAPDVFERWPHARKARLYRGFQSAGDVCFNPSRCVHAVRNVGGKGGKPVVTSLTHNFVDATNLADVIADATRSINDELLPMAKSLKPKSFLKTLAKSLRIPQEELVEALIELPTLLSDQRVEEVIACAAAGAEGDERAPLDTCRGGPDEVAKLLRVELVSRLAEVLPAFESAAFALRTALQLGSSGESL